LKVRKILSEQACGYFALESKALYFGRSVMALLFKLITKIPQLGKMRGGEKDARAHTITALGKMTLSLIDLFATLTVGFKCL
jgi:hypothetical protein